MRTSNVSQVIVVHQVVATHLADLSVVVAKHVLASVISNH